MSLHGFAWLLKTLTDIWVLMLIMLQCVGMYVVQDTCMYASMCVRMYVHQNMCM